MKRTLILAVLIATITSNALAMGSKRSHKGSHKPRHHRHLVIK